MSLRHLLAVVSLAAIPCAAQSSDPGASADPVTTPAATTSSPGFLQQVQSKALAGTVHSVELTGSADWGSGSGKASGTADLKVSLDGSYSITLDSPKASRTETGSASNASRACQWSADDGAVHSVSGLNCLAAMPWFAPALLAPFAAQHTDTLSVTDDGAQTWNGTAVHQISYRMLLTGKDAGVMARLTEATRVKVFFDPTTLLPVGVEYNLHPDADDLRSIPVDVAFTDYRPVGGVMLPFHVVRSINGTVQLTLSLSNVLVS